MHSNPIEISDYHPRPGSRIDLGDWDPSDSRSLDKDATKAEMSAMLERLDALQEVLYAQGEYALLVILQAMDAGGKDGTIRRVFEGVNPQGVTVTSFKQPTSQELAHDFLWRIHRSAPERGKIGIFNRSHYEDVLVVRVENLVEKSVWKQRYDQINQFEALLTASGTRILKFYLHIDKEEQRERLQDRLDRPDKHWKFSIGDLDTRRKWSAYMAAFEDAIGRCNTAEAPWYIIPANRKWFRDYLILRTIIETMEDMGLEYPEAEAGLEHVVIPD